MSSRKLYLLGFLFSISLLGIAGYMQYAMQMEPCPLCALQRLAVLASGMIFLLAAIHHPQRTGAKIYSSLITLVALIGGAISAWHVRLQNLPEDQVPSCGPGLDFIVGNFPLTDALRMIFSGSGECAEVSWTWLGLSIPAWTFVAFIVIVLLAWAAVMKTVKRQKSLF